MHSAIFIILVAFLCNAPQVEARCRSLGPRCSFGWHLWGNSCYLMTDSDYGWVKAGDECRKLGGVLAVPHSPEEDDFIKTFTHGSLVWIGCNDRASEGNWECEEGGVKISYRNWDLSRRQPELSLQDCAAMSADTQGWHDRHCAERNYAICKRPRVNYR